MMAEGMGMRDAIRKLGCYLPGMIESLRAWDLAYLKRINALENRDYPRTHRKQPMDWHIDRLHTVEDQIDRAISDLSKTPCIPPDVPRAQLPPTTPAPTPPPPPPPTPKADVAPEHSSAGTPDNGGLLAANDLAHNDWTLLGNYANFDPSSGASGDQWGGHVRGQWLVGSDVALDVGGGYNNVSTAHTNLDNWTADASVVWYLSNLRVGPTIGYQDNSQSGFHADTWNYGAFAEYFWPYVTLSGKGGGFTTSGSGPSSDGYYLGGALTGYVNPNLSVTGGVDYTHFSPFGGSDETDWMVRGTWRPWAATPVAFWAGYTYSDFSPGSFHVSTISVGVQFDLGNGQTLIESDRGGAIVNQAALTALAFKF